MAILIPQDFEVLEPSIHCFMPTLHPLVLHIVDFYILLSQKVCRHSTWSRGFFKTAGRPTANGQIQYNWLIFVALKTTKVYER
jgi:hypothetical protein